MDRQKLKEMEEELERLAILKTETSNLYHKHLTSVRKARKGMIGTTATFEVTSLSQTACDWNSGCPETDGEKIKCDKCPLNVELEVTRDQAIELLNKWKEEVENG